MFKNKITIKLSLYFSMILITFSIIIGSVFISVFRNYSLDLNRQELEKRASKIAETIPNFLENQKGSIKGFGMYLNVINEIEDNAIWIIDNDLNLITGGSQHSQHQFEYKDLPNNADQVINEVLENKTVFSEEFSLLLDKPTLTVGVPIINESEKVLGVVLLHSAIIGVNASIWQGILILIFSILLALLLSTLLTIILSRYFTKPLVLMNNTAHKLIEHDYQVRNNLDQNDEIGQLANTLDVLASRLDTASKESQQLELMRQEFIANISHELKTPVTVMRGSLEALVDEVVSDPELIASYYKQMLNEAMFLERLIQDLLELSKLESLDFKIEKTEISISEVIDDVLRSAKNMANNKNISLKLRKHVDDIIIFADYERIRQMLLIIIDNAIKFSKPKSEVEITLDKKQLSIKDYGLGMSELEQAHIFERFYMSRSEKNKTGTGLGLSIAKNIAERHNIKLQVESVKNIGSSFIFIIDKADVIKR